MYKQHIYLFTLLLIFTACGGGSGEDSPSQPPISNSSPSARDDALEIFINENIKIDVVANDIDPDRDALFVSSVNTPASGSVEISDNQIDYTPSENFIGTDTFSYTIGDNNGGESTATVTVTINNRPPTTVNDTVLTNQSASVEIDVLSNDSSSGNHNLTIVGLSEPGNGLLSLENDSVTYKPSDGYVGQDSFAYTVRDSIGDESSASVLVTIQNIVPVANEDVSNTEQNRSVVLDVVANDIDASGDFISISGNTLPEHGTLLLEENAFTYTPNIGYSGFDQFDYTIVDNFGDNSQTTVTIEVVNVTPVTNQDNVTAFAGVELEIDVLANDFDVEGDEITVQSVSQPINGTASVIDNKVYYQPNVDFTGDDPFGYTIIDSYGDSSSNFIGVTVIEGIKLSGKVVGQEIEGLEVRVLSGTDEVLTTTDDEGMYEVIVSVVNKENLVIMSAANPNSDYVYKAYFDDIDTLIELSDSTYSVEGLNLTDFTTAEFELLEAVKGVSEINDLKSLYDYRAQLIPLFQLEGTVAALLINADNAIELPSNFTSINELLQSPFLMREQLSLWRKLYPTDYYAVFDSLFDNDELTSVPENIVEGNYIFQQGSEIARLFNTTSMVIHSNGEGYYLGEGLFKNNFSWTKTNQYIETTFATPFEVLSLESKYCGGAPNPSVSFNADSSQLRQLYSTVEYDVFIRKNTGAFSARCLDNTVHTTEFDTFRLYKPKPFSIGVGEYYLESVRLSEPDEIRENEDYHRTSALFSFAEDGNFTEVIDEITEQRNGQWAMVDNSLVLSYPNDFVVTYQLISNFDDLSVLSYQTLDGGDIAAASHTFIVEKDDSFTLANTTGMYANHPNVLFDENIDSRFRLNYLNDGTGSQSNFLFGAWSDSTRSLYSWELMGNKYNGAYYYDTELQSSVNFCDVSLNDCLIYRQRTFEVIGKKNDYYIIKNYQEANAEGPIIGPFRSGYISLFSFEEIDR